MYEILEKYEEKINNANVKILVIKINDIKETISFTYEKIRDLSWLNKIDSDFVRNSLMVRGRKTIEHLAQTFLECNNLNNSTGEYIVSVMSKQAILDTYKNYSDIPLAELLGEKKSNNGGFDYHCENIIENHIIFGEAKYKSNASAYNSALSQVVRFIGDEKDHSDAFKLQNIVSEESQKNFLNGSKGYSAAFSLKEKHKDFKSVIDEYQELTKCEELILIGVEFDE